MMESALEGRKNEGKKKNASKNSHLTLARHILLILLLPLSLLLLNYNGLHSSLSRSSRRSSPSNVLSLKRFAEEKRVELDLDSTLEVRRGDGPEYGDEELDPTVKKSSERTGSRRRRRSHQSIPVRI